jgi:protein-S-isoprenylcysteine O-methyltransferase Ste14
MTPANEIRAASRKALVKGIVAQGLVAGVLFGGSGDGRWIAAWLLVAVFVAAQIAAFREMKRQPDLLVERSKLQPGTKPWDKLLVALLAVVVPLLTWSTAALDHRYGWSGREHIALVAAGFVLMVLGIRLTQRAIAENRFFAATVRIQADRGQTVVSSGPYAYVRHPGYTGILGLTIGTPLALGSAWALLPAALGVIVLIVRTVLEESTLRAGLAGYADYTKRVRSRFVPHVW